jgi:predicted PurR-regulated permease PerM
VGLDFGLLIGLTAGALSFVPYLGALVGFVASVGMAVVQFWPSWIPVAVVAAIFFVGQWVSDYVITPRIVGDRIKVHPLWVLFGFFAGGALFGFVGMLVSVPACAVIGVVARFGIARYKASPYYRGGSEGDPAELD